MSETERCACGVLATTKWTSGDAVSWTCDECMPGPVKFPAPPTPTSAADAGAIARVEEYDGLTICGVTVIEERHAALGGRPMSAMVGWINEAHARICPALKERDEARAEINNLKAALEAIVDALNSGIHQHACSYCGHMTEGGRPETQDEIRAHMDQCPKHPMATLREQNEALRQQIRGAIHCMAVLIHKAGGELRISKTDLIRMNPHVEVIRIEEVSPPFDTVFCLAPLADATPAQRAEGRDSDGA